MYLQQEALLRPDLEGKEAAVCLPCYHIYRFLEQHYYKQGQEKLSEISHETPPQPSDVEGLPTGIVIGSAEEISPQFESSQTRGEPASNVRTPEPAQERSTILVQDGSQESIVQRCPECLRR